MRIKKRNYRESVKRILKIIRNCNVIFNLKIVRESLIEIIEEALRNAYGYEARRLFKRCSTVYKKEYLFIILLWIKTD